MNEKFEEAKKASTWSGEPRISTRYIIKEAAKHAGVKYEVAADCVYAFLNIAKFAAFSTEQKVNVRNFGQFAPTTIKGREYGRAVGSPIYRPARIKLTLKASPLMEVDRWKNTLSIQKKVSTALNADLKPQSMDLSICVRIADLVLSNRPMSELKGPDKIAIARQWIYATGAAPLLPGPDHRFDDQDNPFTVLKFRLRGADRQVCVFDTDPSPTFAAMVVNSRYDILFYENGWSYGGETSDAVAKHYDHGELTQTEYGTTAEEQTTSLFQAYMAAKYGKKG